MDMNLFYLFGNVEKPRKQFDNMPEMVSHNQSDHHHPYLYTKVNKDFKEMVEDHNHDHHAVIIKTSHSTTSSSSSSRNFNLNEDEDSNSSRSISTSISIPLHHIKPSGDSTPASHSSVFIDDVVDIKDDMPCSNGGFPPFKEPIIIDEFDDVLNPNKEDNTATDSLGPNNYFNFLDDFIRFDVLRTGISCFFGYSVGVQYEDDLLVGKAGTPCYLSMVCRSKSRVRLWHHGKAFEVVYRPRNSCIRPKDCTYEVKIRGEGRAIGTIHFKEDLVHIYNAYEGCLAIRRKQGSNCYSIKTEAGDRLASVEIFRGLRGDILYYGLSILGDASSTDKALLIGLTVAMDIRQRESEMRCSLIWVPLACILVIGVFSFLPWLYFYDENMR